jgi:ribokinase
VVVLGSLNADVFARVQRHPRPGETVLGSGGEVRAGGKGANQAAAAALAGARVVMVGAVGSDAYAAVATGNLARAGVSLDAVRTVDGPTGLALITVSADGENSIIVIPGANAQVGEPELAQLDSLDAGDVLVLQGEVPVESVTAAALAAAARGARVVLNLAPVIDLPAGVLRLADPLVVNEHEGAGALRLLGGGALRLVDADPTGGSPTELCAALREHGVPSVVMTLGGQGALIAAAGPVTAIPAEKVAVVDTTGAGDAFAGALAAGLCAGEDLVAAAQRASRFAAEAVQHEGAQDSYPDWRS